MISLSSPIVSAADSSRYFTATRSPCRRIRGRLPETMCRSEPSCFTSSSRKVSMRLTAGSSATDQGDLRQQALVGHEALEQLLVVGMQVGVVGIDLLRLDR